MNYVGLDIHARNFTISVLSKDNMTIFETELPTSADNLRSVIGAIAEPKCVVLEESTVAAWAYRTILPCAAQVIVAEVLGHLDNEMDVVLLVLNSDGAEEFG